MTSLQLPLSSIALAAVLCGSASSQTTFTTVPGAGQVNDITPDGKVVVGWGSGGGYYWRWEQDPLPVFIGGIDARAVSDDGSVILGNMADPGTGAQVAGIWTQATGWQTLGFLPTAYQCPSLSTGYDISGDGTTAVGLSWDACNAVAFRWTQATGMLPMDHLANGQNRASAISANGLLIGGFAQGDFSRTPAIWDALGNGQVFDSSVVGEIWGVDDTGTTVLGEWDGDAFYQNATDGFVNLGSLNPGVGWVGQATDISEDGTVVVGQDTFSLASEAWIWREGVGIESLRDHMTALGVAAVPELHRVQAMTPDGLTIVGFTNFGPAWIARRPAPSEISVYGCGVNPAGSMTVLSGLPTIGTTLTLGLDNPLGSQAPGSLPFVVLATAPVSSTGFPCGLPLLGFGMAPGGVGELLIDILPPNPILPALGGNPWAGAGSPAPVQLVFPANANFVGNTLYAQGVLLNFSAVGVPVGLTDAVEMKIGN